MKYMITEYQKTSAEILVLEVSMGSYMLSTPLEELDSEEVLMLHTVSHGLMTESSDVEALVEPVKDNGEPTESNDDLEDNQLALLGSFQEFIQKCIEGQIQLGRRMNFEELLFPNWCRVHNVSHLELDCFLCQAAVKQIQKYTNPTPVVPITIQEDHKGKGMIPSKEVSGGNNTSKKAGDSAVAICWTLRFDVSKSKQGARIGFELISPKGKKFFAAHRLQFHFTNNVAEY